MLRNRLSTKLLHFYPNASPPVMQKYCSNLLMINFLFKLITIFVHKGTLTGLIASTLKDLWSILRVSWACQRCACWGRGRRPCAPWRRTTPRPATSSWPAGGGSWSAPGALHRLAKTWTRSFLVCSFKLLSLSQTQMFLYLSNLWLQSLSSQSSPASRDSANCSA